LVAKKTARSEIEQRIIKQFALPGGNMYTDLQSVGIANQMLSSIPEGEFRAYLPEGKAILFHEAEPWNGYPESIWRWQCLPGSRYQKEEALARIQKIRRRKPSPGHP